MTISPRSSVISNARHLTRRVVSAACVAALAAGTVTIAPLVSAPSALAAATDIDMQSMVVSPLSSAGAPKLPGQTFTYTIGFGCASTSIGTCAGATFDDLLPQFTDVFGGVGQMIKTGSITATPGIWASGPAFTGAGTDVHVTGTLNATTNPGDLYSLTFSAIAPQHQFPTGQTTLLNVATSSGNTSPTVSSVVAATAPVWTITKTGPATLLLGANGTYTITACAAAASAFPAAFSLSDMLPAGAHFVSASNGGVAPAGDPANGTTDAVAWTFNTLNHPWPIVSNCLHVTQVVSYTEDPALGNVTGVTKTNTASGLYDATSLGSSSVGTQLRGPITSANGDKNVNQGGYYVQVGDSIRYGLRFNNSSEVGATALDSAVVIDDLTLAPYYGVSSIDTGSWGSGVTADIATSVDGSVYTPVGGSPFTGTNPNAAVPPGTKYIRWTFHGPIPVGFTTSGMYVYGSMTVPPSFPVAQRNCLNVTGLRGVATYSDNGNCADTLLEVSQAHPFVTKTVTGVTAADGITAHAATAVTPGDTVHYTIVVRNDIDATGNLTDPVVTDCMARTDYFSVANLILGAGWTQDLAYSDGACTTAGGTPVRLVYSGAAIVPGNSSTAATYDEISTQFGDPEGVTLPGNYPNTANLTKATGTFAHGGLTSTATVTVPAYIYLSSQKWVLGDRDTNITADPGPSNSRKAGETDPGGAMTFFITVQNKGNVPALNPVYVDVFPHIGDTGVKRTDQTRDSEWAPYLVKPVAVPAGWAVQYSTSMNPCRPEVGPTPSSPTIWPPGCETPNWSSVDSLFVLTTYHSIRLTYTGVIPTGGPAVQFSWDMRAPVYDPVYDAGGIDSTNPYERLAGCNMDPDPFTQDPATVNPCPRAINSFAWAAEADPASVNPAFNPGRLSTEPPRVGVQIRQLPNVDNVIGDRVWNDTNFNGLQDSGEPGVGGIYVELARFDTGLSVWQTYGYTYTDPNGNYLFANPGLSAVGLPDGDYKVRFALPDQYYISPPDRDGLGAVDLGYLSNGNTDSDVPQTPSGTTSGVPYYETPVITLGTNETDLSWDAGVWEASPAVTIDKVTKDVGWNNSDAADGVTVIQGRPLQWNYHIVNTGNARLENVVVTDDNGTPGNPGDNFTVTACVVSNAGLNEDAAKHSSRCDWCNDAQQVAQRSTAPRQGIAGSGGATPAIATMTSTPRMDDGA